MRLSDLPEIEFAKADPEQIAIEVVGIVEELLGRKLQRADPLRLFLRGVESVIIQQRLLINELARQNLLAYATGDNLDHMGVLVGVERLAAANATATVEVKLSTAREQATIIPKGTRVNAGNNIDFALDEDLIFVAGEVAKVAKVTCAQEGDIGNGFAIGELNKIVDPRPFLLSMTNTTATEGGADIESDEHLRERIREAPESFSVAGPGGAYEFHAKKVSALISDVAVASESPGEVSVWVLLQNGVIPETEMLNAVLEALNDKAVRPLTDKVLVKPPNVIDYNIDLKYWVARSDQTSAVTIQQRAETAVEEFISWQKAKLGRDLNETELYWRLRSAGVKRAEIYSPKFLAINSHSVCICKNISAVYAGLEDD